jgi:hypothetical protein
MNAPSRQLPRTGFGLSHKANVALAILSIIPAVRVVMVSWNRNDIWAYSAGEWLISFQEGAVRRGLSGTLLFSLPGSQKYAVVLVVLTLSLAVPAAFALLVHRALIASHSWMPVIWWFVPGGLLVGMWQGVWQPLPNAALVFSARKEYLLYLVLMTFVLLVPGRVATWRGMVAFGSMFAACIFIHEGVTLLAVCAAVLWLIRVTHSIGREMIAFLAPVGLAAAVMLTLPRTDAGLQWAAVDAATQQWLGGAAPMSLFAATFAPADGFALVQHQVLDTGVWFGWAVVACLGAGWLAVACWLTDRGALRLNLAGAATLLFMAGLLALVGSDWGRWIVSALVMSAVLVLGTAGRRPPVEDSGRAGLVVAVALVGASLITAVPDSGAGAGLPLLTELSGHLPN